MDFNATLLDIQEYGIKMKATIQQTGKLSFTEATARNLELVEDKRFLIFRDNQKPNDILYMVGINEEHPNYTKAFVVKKSGMYYYMATKTLFDILGIDYKATSYAYDIVRLSELDEQTGGTTYRLTRRVTGNKETRN